MFTCFKATRTIYGSSLLFPPTTDAAMSWTVIKFHSFKGLLILPQRLYCKAIKVGTCKYKLALSFISNNASVPQNLTCNEV